MLPMCAAVAMTPREKQIDEAVSTRGGWKYSKSEAFSGNYKYLWEL